jgi:CrcB protein
LLKFLVLGVAGGIGTLARFWLSSFAQRFARGPFPVGTLAVNLIGCLLTGVVLYLVRDLHAMRPETRTVVVVGLLGGFTTFSAFGSETFELARVGSFALAGANVLGNVVAGIGAVRFGAAAARAVLHG